MRKPKQIALILGILLPIFITPMLLLASKDVCSAGPLSFLTNSDSSYNEGISDYIIIGVISALLIGYGLNWLSRKSIIDSIGLWLGLLAAEFVVLFAIILVVNNHCWVF